MNPVARRMALSALVNAAVPLLVYVLIRPHTHSDAEALLIGAAIPLAVTVGTWLWGGATIPSGPNGAADKATRGATVALEGGAVAHGAAVPIGRGDVGVARRRRVDPMGVMSLVGFGVAALALWLTGGDPLVLKLHDAIITGPLGIAFVVSALVGHPLLNLASHLSTATTPRDAYARRAVSVMTILLGATLIVHALLILVLALTLPTTAFLAARPVGWLVIAAGLTTVFAYRARARAAVAARTRAGTEATAHAQAETRAKTGATETAARAGATADHIPAPPTANHPTPHKRPAEHR